MGTITIIKISTSGASSINGTMAVTVGGVAFLPASITLTTTNTEYTFTGSGSGEILITWNQSSSKALYLKKLVVEYTSGSTPTITLAPTTLSGFNYTVGAGPSAAQSFTVEGSNLTNDISIAASTNYEISETEGSGYTTPIEFIPSGGTVSTKTIYVRLKAGLLAGDFNSEDIEITSIGATSKAVTCSGEVVAAPDPEPTNQVADFSATAMSSSQIDLSWTDAATGSQAPAGYLILANTTGTFIAPVDGTDPSVDADLSDGSAIIKVTHGGAASYSFSGLLPSTQYYFKIWSYSNSGATINFKTDGTVPTGNATTNVSSGPCGTETFNNSNATTSYSSSSFVGDNGVSWTYVESRDEGSYAINGKGLMLRMSSDNSKVTSSAVTGGISEFTCSLKKAFTGAGTR